MPLEISMLTVVEVRSLVKQVFEEEALTLGGMAALKELKEDQLWQIMRHFDVIRSRALLRLDAAARRVKQPRPPVVRRDPGDSLDWFRTSRRAS